MVEDQSNIVHALPYSRAGEALRREIAWLQHRAAPELSPPPGNSIAPEHDPALDALSFYLRLDERVVSYAAVVHVPIVHASEPYLVAGLSCVATDPAYQRRGLGSRVVAAATRAILDSTADIGLFTCDPPLVAFYARAGDWRPAPGIILLGNRLPGALSSTTLGKAVLMRLVSARAQAAAASLETATISLDLPSGQFL
jgi:GNAT superfamily N-acetyltransferase